MCPPKQLDGCTLLYVEDDDATAYLFQSALSEIGLSPQVFRVTDGEHAMAFLLKQGAYTTAPRPDLVLLDLNMPRKSGFDVLAETKGNPRLRDITVIVFSTSTMPYDREKSLELGADDYLRRDGDFESFVRAAEWVCRRLTAEQGRAYEQFCCSTSLLPVRLLNAPSPNCAQS